jgi:methyl-accepting chemotaxis protein
MVAVRRARRPSTLSFNDRENEMSNRQKSYHLRRQYFVDPKVQGALLIRAVVYWFFCLSTVFIALLCWQILSSPVPRMFYSHFVEAWDQYWRVLAASLLLLPVIAIDCVRFANRFAGPVLRLKSALQRLAAGEQVEPIQFRSNDFWTELADSFNAVAQRAGRERLNARQTSADDESEANEPHEAVDEPEPMHAA